MKKLTVPSSVQLSVFNEETKAEESKEFTFSEFLINNALVHRAFGSSIDFLEHSLELTEQLMTAQVGDVIELDDKVWEVLNIVVNHPEHPYSDVKLARKLLPFMRAIKNVQ